MVGGCKHTQKSGHYTLTTGLHLRASRSPPRRRLVYCAPAVTDAAAYRLTEQIMEPTITIALRAARKAGDTIVRAGDRLERIEVQRKGANDFVSEVDRAAERDIIFQLSKAYPGHAFLGEESGLTGNPDSDYLWIIDPLDGTTNFLRGIPHYCVSIACSFRGRVEHAVVLDPVRREEFVASRGRGAQLNGTRIRVSKQASLEGALLGTGIPFRSRNQDRLSAYCDSLETLAGQTAGIRRAGAAALDLAYVAAGRLDAFWEVGLSRWDIAAGVLLVQEAGGLVSDMDGGDAYMDSGDIVCGSPKCFKAVLQAVQPVLGSTANGGRRASSADQGS